MAVDGIVAALRGVGGPQLYRRNAFRITGLPTDADRKTVRHRQRRVLAALEAGADVDLGHDLPVDTEAVRAAFDEILENPHRRLVDELFWLWGTGTACECTGSVHADHDEAVLAHSTALDLELSGENRAAADRAWTTAARQWGTVLRRNGFWNHLRARIAELDERQLDESVVAVLRDRVPLTLLQPLIDLATGTSSHRARTIGRARSWPGVPDGTADHLLEDAAASRYEDAETAIAETSDVLRSGDPERAAALFHKAVVPSLQRLGSLVPHSRHRRTARVRDRAALVLNNCATRLVEQAGLRSKSDARKWLTTALELATDPQSQQTIRANQASIDEMVSVFEVIEERVTELLRARRPDVARSMLLDIKRKLNGGTGTSEVDRLLDRVARAPAPFQSFGATGRYHRVPRVKYHSPWRAVRGWWRWHWRKVVFLAAVVVAVYVFWPDGDEGPSSAPNLGDNEVLGTCVATEDGWTGDEGKDEVPVVPCDEPHRADNQQLTGGVR